MNTKKLFEQNAVVPSILTYSEFRDEYDVSDDIQTRDYVYALAESCRLNDCYLNFKKGLALSLNENAQLKARVAELENAFDIQTKVVRGYQLKIAELEECNANLQSLQGMIELSEDVEAKSNHNGVTLAYDLHGKAWVKSGFKIVADSEEGESIANVKAEAIREAKRSIIDKWEVTKDHVSILCDDRYVYISNRAIDEYADKVERGEL